MTPQQARRSREEVECALVEAAIRVLERDGASALSTRQVAQEAQVNPGLVHRYFGSMAALSARVLDELAARIAAQVGTGVEFSAGSALDCYARVLTHAIVSGRDPRALQAENPLADRLVGLLRDRAGLGIAEAQVCAAQILTLYLGWAVFGEFAAHSAQVEADRDALVESLRQAAIDLAVADTQRASGSAPRSRSRSSSEPETPESPER
jgi:AcrR family transcriptional regulator